MKRNPNYSFLHKNWKKHRIFALQGSSRSGKTFSVLQYYIKMCYKYQDAGMVLTICRKTLAALKGSAYREFIDLLKEIGIYSEDNHNKSEHEYNLYGNLVEFIGVDQPDKVRGRKRHVLYANEINELTLEDWRQLMIRTGGKAIVDYNPSMTDDHWVFNKLLTRRDVGLLITTYKDNPFLTKAQIDEIELLAEQDYEYFKVFGLGQRGSLYKGIIFKKWELYNHRAQGRVIYGLDFGYSDTHPTALVKVTIDGNNCYLETLLYECGMTAAETAQRIKALNIGHAPVYCDTARPEAIRQLFQDGINTMDANKRQNSVKDGIDLMKSKNLFIHQDDLYLQKEIKNYKWQVNREGTELGEPVKFLDDALDAARYAIFTYSSVPIADTKPRFEKPIRYPKPTR